MKRNFEKKMKFEEKLEEISQKINKIELLKDFDQILGK